MSAGSTSIPGFLRTLRGLWLFTWKSQLTWRRLPVHLALLLSLPTLVYLTATFRARMPERMPDRPAFGSDLDSQFRRFNRSLERAGEELTAEQEETLPPLFREELASLYPAPAGGETRLSKDDLKARRDRIRAAYERLGKRLASELKPEQMTVYENFVQRRLQESERPTQQRVWDRTGKYYHWIVDIYLFVILPLVCVNVCGGLIRDELQADTLGFLLTRPVSRARLLIAKYLAQTAWLQILLLVETLLLVAAGWGKDIQGLGALLPLLLGIQFLAIFAWGALGALLGQITKRYLAFALLYGLIVERGIGSIPTNINTLSITRHLKTLLTHHPSVQALYNWPGEGGGFAVLALLVATIVFLALAVGLFTFVEYHRTSEAQK